MPIHISSYKYIAHETNAIGKSMHKWNVIRTGKGELAGEISALHGFVDGFQTRIIAETPGRRANTSQGRPEQTEAG